MLREKPLKNYPEITPAIAEDYVPGAILFDTWGNEQTNIDYYCIVERSGLFVTIMPMKKIEVSEGTDRMITLVSPDCIDFDATPTKKKIRLLCGEEIGFTMRNYSGGGWVRLWNGKAKVASHYA